MGAVAYELTPDPIPAERVSITPRHVEAALRAFFRITKSWGVTTEQARVLLGRPGRSTLFTWQQRGARRLPHDTLQRISFVLGIYAAVQVLFEREDLADAWVRKPNEAFAGSSALDRMLAGDITDLAAVRWYLDSVRGQGR